MQSTLVSVQGKGSNPKNVLYVGGLEESINEATLHSAFIAFGDIKDVNIPLDNTTGVACARRSLTQVYQPAPAPTWESLQASIEASGLWSTRTRLMPRTRSTTCTTPSCMAGFCVSTMRSQ